MSTTERAVDGAPGGDAAGHERLLALALAQLPATVLVVFDRDQTILLAHGPLLTGRGLTPEMLVGRRAGAILPPDRHDLYLPAIEAALEGRPTSLRVPGFDVEQVFDVEFAPVISTEGDVIGGQMVAYDVTAEDQLLRRLEASEQRFRLLAENASDVVYLAGADGSIRWASPSSLAVLGIDPADMVGRRTTSLVHPDEVEFVREGRSRLYGGEHGDRGRSTTRFLTASGEYHSMAVTVRRVVDVDGTPAAVISLRDVEDEQRALRRAEESEAQFRLTMERASVGMALVDADACYLDVNPAMLEMLGYDREEVVGTSFMAFTHPDDVESGREPFRQTVAGEIPGFQRRKRYLRKDGSTLWVDLAVTGVFDSAGTFRHNVAQWIDVTGEVENAAVLEQLVHRYRLLAENASDIVYEVDPGGVITWVSPSLTAVLGWAPEDWLGRKVTEVIVSSSRSSVTDEVERFFSGEEIDPEVARFPTSDGSVRVMAVTVHAAETADGLPRSAVVGLHDITEQVETRRELARSEERFRLAMAAAPIGMALSDPTGAFVQVNGALCELLGLPEADLLGRSVSDFLVPEEQHVADDATQALDVQRDESMRHEHRLATGTRTVWVEHAASLLRDDDDEPLFYVHQFVDRTEAHQLRADLEYRATHDALTGVINRGELMSQLDHSLRRMRGTSAWLGVLFVDVDNLKLLNDEHGHHAGDVAIRTVATRLSGAVRAGDLVARLGGDEFVVLLESVHSRAELAAVAEKLRLAVEGDIDVDGNPLDLGVSVGAVLAGHDEDPDAVLARADHGLRRAKEAGRHQVDVD